MCFTTKVLHQYLPGTKFSGRGIFTFCQTFLSWEPTFPNLILYKSLTNRFLPRPEAIIYCKETYSLGKKVIIDSLTRDIFEDDYAKHGKEKYMQQTCLMTINTSWMGIEDLLSISHKARSCSPGTTPRFASLSSPEM